MIAVCIPLDFPLIQILCRCRVAARHSLARMGLAPVKRAAPTQASSRQFKFQAPLSVAPERSAPMSLGQLKMFRMRHRRMILSHADTRLNDTVEIAHVSFLFPLGAIGVLQ